MTARIGVITFPGTLDDRDAARAARFAGAEAVNLWHADSGLAGVDAVVLPGGFSYGDYLRAGALSSLTPIMGSVIDAARGGLPVLGICNGFQILCEAGLLAGAMVNNEKLSFLCRDQRLRIDNADTPWTRDFTLGDEFVVPLKNQEGQFIADEATLAELEGEGRVVFRYVDNPNGSRNDIAGITNAAGNVVGLMPHPEHAIEPGFGPGTDGLRVFTSVLDSLLAHA
ncbi:phosphoribosylformylglycinamidine synthase subunit PurQ [Pseudactinotalea sp. HY158]|uniref:phosphoribosylformylglycinamidine synthase subunit PurQ n=1 Tax=unclassified Pseudactinotalea TaxID=2649176 RepID=UPI00129C5C50|nr:phosphoribosylformylglycinamidine synthase subunit PurQ [Pseudactinotalea sp. HY158]MPV51281.1 phosphoribosylformylglycinamidine synthase subunit PurQ [Pseudactinotalea sp. HY160]QGH70626.1 phosphoribosylformylglycinamidine synthase subunit PurQ [Pseudactinotalea sp. HY158]